jgi:hypothetical protein
VRHHVWSTHNPNKRSDTRNQSTALIRRPLLIRRPHTRILQDPRSKQLRRHIRHRCWCKYAARMPHANAHPIRLAGFPPSSRCDAALKHTPCGACGARQVRVGHHNAAAQHATNPTACPQWAHCGHAAHSMACCTRAYEKKCEFFQSIRGKTRSRNATSATAGWCVPFVSTPARYALASRESQPYLCACAPMDARQCRVRQVLLVFVQLQCASVAVRPERTGGNGGSAATAQCHPWVGVAALRCGRAGRVGRAGGAGGRAYMKAFFLREWPWMSQNSTSCADAAPHWCGASHCIEYSVPLSPL